jgi:CHASE3 domain sensor protein
MTQKQLDEKIEDLESAVQGAKEEAASAKRRSNMALEKLAYALEKIDDKKAIQKLAKELRDEGFLK